ncbi:MFS transporter [Bacillus sp. AGMB 02131]|uniref:MFS transporter n=1 Tax=Peribacillus faecalis TaxID=2772559 RepID=A0A927CXU3_9BACI|nr:MFS transporter [Peribacillus faecalis]MBD3109712.1 MFS transporter [Peribacillus faecalis]
MKELFQAISTEYSIYKDKRFRYVLAANIASSIGLGITMIAIPWFLVSSPDGNTTLGYITLLMTIFNFALTPLIGGLIDKFPRKKLLIAGELVGLLIVVIFSCYGFMGNIYELRHYIVLFVTGSLYYTIFYPTMFAFTQEYFNKQYYKSLNGAMEVQGQIASMVAGGIAGAMIMTVPLQWILLLNAMTYMIAILFFIKVKSERKETVSKIKKRENMKTGFVYMLKHPKIFYFLIFATFPFIGVMITNYLFPVYLQQVLHADVWVYGLEGMIYSLGAVCAGLFVPFIAKKIGNEKTMVYGVLCYAAAVSLIIFVDIPLYLSLMFFLALGNAGSRVARQTFMMEHIPNEYMGRVDSVIRFIGLFIRIILLMLFTKLISVQAVILCFGILSVLLWIAAISVYILSKKGLFWTKETHIMRLSQE